MMSDRVIIGGLKIDQELFNFVENEILPGTSLAPIVFWQGLEKTLKELAPENARLLQVREDMQSKIDAWHQNNPGPIADYDCYEAFLHEIGYLQEEGPDFAIETSGLDREISTLAGAQLVVPISNARFAINAANARWGSLYDALYGSDIIEGEAPTSKEYDQTRGAKVVIWVRDFLCKTFPLDQGSFKDVTGFRVTENSLELLQKDGCISRLEDEAQFIGFKGSKHKPTSILLCNNGLHVDVHIDAKSEIGKFDVAEICDVWLEAALSTIMDFEDSVAAVNAQDKVSAYRNWLGLIKGDLAVTMRKGGRDFRRVLSQDREYQTPHGHNLSLKGRSLMLVRNVGHLMTTDAILIDGKEIPEGIMDAFVTAAIAKHDIVQSHNEGHHPNSDQGAIYIIKPKMHGPEEVAFSNRLFASVEDALLLPRYSLKMGIMDEERRTSANLKECIREAKHRVFFINTGFLDRTGDEIHTSMQAGPFVPKGAIKSTAWINAYEKRNVQIGLKCGFSGKAQIGKGMWAMPDEMSQMMDQKIDHPLSGASTAWVPSPTAAVLHAVHYHKVNVKEIQSKISTDVMNIKELLTVPVMGSLELSQEEIQRELNNSTQSILGYVVRWINDGVGCSKVPDINDVGLMEDRATLRISSQHIANWLHHGICNKAQVLETFKRMAKVVDQQNSKDANYKLMSENFEGDIAFSAACALVFDGLDQPSGYTEPLLHAKRQEYLSITL